MSIIGRTTGAVRGSITRLARSAVGPEAVPFWAGGGVLAILLATTVALGGFGETQPTPSALGAGDQARLSLYSATVIDAHLAEEIEEEYVTAEEGEILVVVTMRLENLAPYPVGVGRSVDRVSSRLLNVSEPLLALSGVAPASSAEAWRTDDSSGGVILQPRVPADVQLVWPVPEESVADGRITLDVYDAEETRGQVILSSDHITWRRSALAAQFTLDIAEDV